MKSKENTDWLIYVTLSIKPSKRFGLADTIRNFSKELYEAGIRKERIPVSAGMKPARYNQFMEEYGEDR